MNPSRKSVPFVSASLLGVIMAITPVPSHAAVVAPASVSECPSGSFCVWTGTSFTGSMQKITTTNSYRAITVSSTQSYDNNRTKRTWLHDQPDGSGSNACINPGARKSSTSGWQATAEAAYLATITTC